ncbi:MAG TPA: single-stranded DNA-binding protein [Acidobacteriaceae bacterium]|nr:single-stranded DNA-binding protein [Acidobacteriaceae bacterium]
MTRNSISLAAMVGSAPKTHVIQSTLTYTTFDLTTFGSHRNWAGKEVTYHEKHHIVCVGSLDTFARSLKVGAEIEVEGELRTRRYTHYIGEPVEVEIIHGRREVVATSIRPFMSVVAETQKANVDQVLIALYRPEEF